MYPSIHAGIALGASLSSVYRCAITCCPKDRRFPRLVGLLRKTSMGILLSREQWGILFLVYAAYWAASPQYPGLRYPAAIMAILPISWIVLFSLSMAAFVSL